MFSWKDAALLQFWLTQAFHTMKHFVKRLEEYSENPEAKATGEVHLGVSCIYVACSGCGVQSPQHSWESSWVQSYNNISIIGICYANTSVLVHTYPPPCPPQHLWPWPYKVMLACLGASLASLGDCEGTFQGEPPWVNANTSQVLHCGHAWIVIPLYSHATAQKPQQWPQVHGPGWLPSSTSLQGRVHLMSNWQSRKLNLMQRKKPHTQVCMYTM